MARGAVGLSLTGLFVVFLVTLIVLPYISRIFPTVSGFEAMGETEQEMEAEEGEEGFEDMSCKPGLKPCPEGYFCEQNTCVAILPRFDINQVTGLEDQI
jgi:hypothetical protein